MLCEFSLNFLTSFLKTKGGPNDRMFLSTNNSLLTSQNIINCLCLLVESLNTCEIVLPSPALTPKKKINQFSSSPQIQLTKLQEKQTKQNILNYTTGKDFAKCRTLETFIRQRLDFLKKFLKRGQGKDGEGSNQIMVCSYLLKSLSFRYILKYSWMKLYD